MFTLQPPAVPTLSLRYASNVKLDGTELSGDFLSFPLFLHEWRQTNLSKWNVPSWLWQHRKLGLEAVLRGQPFLSYTDPIWGTVSDHADVVVISVWLVATEDDPGSQKLVLSRNWSIFAVKQQTSLKSEQSKCLFVLSIFMMNILHWGWNGKISICCNESGSKCKKYLLFYIISLTGFPSGPGGPISPKSPGNPWAHSETVWAEGK